MGVDWWALGILVFEMLDGQPPFYAPTPFEVYKKICHLPNPKIKYNKHNFDIRAKGFVGKLLTTDRKKRLGCGKGGVLQVKRDKWFTGLDWKAVGNKQLEVPFLPKRNNHKTVENEGGGKGGFEGEQGPHNFDEYPDSDEDVGLPLNGRQREMFLKFDEI